MLPVIVAAVAAVVAVGIGAAVPSVAVVVFAAAAAVVGIGAAVPFVAARPATLLPCHSLCRILPLRPKRLCSVDRISPLSCLQNCCSGFIQPLCFPS